MEKYLDANKLEAEIAKLIAETLELRQESRWMPLVWTAGLFATATAVVKLFS